MGTVSLWAEHWFTILQSVGIIAGLVFTGLAARESAKVRRVQLLIDLTEQHRSLWMRPFEAPSLLRVLSAKVDLVKEPPTQQEKIFLNLIFLHLNTVLEAVRESCVPKPDGMDADLLELLQLPLPRQVWEATKKFRDKDTIQYVQAILDSASKMEQPIS